MAKKKIKEKNKKKIQPEADQPLAEKTENPEVTEIKLEEAAPKTSALKTEKKAKVKKKERGEMYKKVNV